MPNPNREFSYGGNMYNLSGVSDLSKFTVQVDVTRYAYNMRGTTMILSCMILLSYTISVGVPSVFILMKGSSSNFGDGASEVTALAMESQPTRY